MEDFMAPLKQLRIWCCWIWKQIENGKPSKKLIATTGGPSGTSTNWSHTWVTYDEAVAEYERCKNGALGRLIAARELPILRRAKEMLDTL